MIQIDQSDFALYTAPPNSAEMDLRVKVVHQETGQEAIGSKGNTQTANRNLACRQLIQRLLELYGVHCRPKFYLFDDVKNDGGNGVAGHITRMEYDGVTKEWKYRVEVEGVTDLHLYVADELQVL